MTLYDFEMMKTIAYAANSSLLLIRDSRNGLEPVHKHDYYELVYIYEGESVHIVNDESYRLSAGSLVFLTPDDTHSFFSIEECSLVNICFSPQALKSPVSSVTFINPTATLNLNGRLEIESLLYLAEQELDTDDNYSDGIADLCLEWILSVFRRYNATTATTDPIWNNLLIEIANNFNTITLEDAAKITGVSTSHFCRIFQKNFSTTFHSYITAIRIRQAKQLLLTTNYSIAEIAEKVGYQKNHCRFYSNFKTITGITPNTFKKQCQNNSNLTDEPFRSFIPEPNGVYPNKYFVSKEKNDNKLYKNAK